MGTLAACSPASGALTSPPPSSVEAGDSTPTATIVWFPPTATWTPYPTILPSATPVPFPGIGAVTFSDSFSDPTVWSNAKAASDGGNNIIVNRQRLTIALNVSPASLTSVRQQLLLTDFYTEVQANVNRCDGADAYGLLVRAADSNYAYRFVLACNGQTRVERVRGGEVIPLQNWVPSGDVPPGAPGQVKIAVWAAGVELRFFLNDHYQFTVLDPVFRNGSVGLYASASSPVGMNVSFSNLVVRAVDYVSPTPTATPSRTPTPTRTPRATP